MKNIIGIAAAAMVLSAAGLAADSITAGDAKNHIGENATVCGVVASARYADRRVTQPTFLNLDKPYPNTIFTIFIRGVDRPKFGSPDVTYRNKHVCASGLISEFGGQPEIVARDPKQIQEQ